jgi:hypothetical protein
VCDVFTASENNIKEEEEIKKKKKRKKKVDKILWISSFCFFHAGDGGIYLFPATCTKDLTTLLDGTKKNERERRAQVADGVPTREIREKKKEKKNQKIPQTHVRLSRRQSRPPGALKNRWCSFLFHSIGLKEIVLLAEDEEETGRSESNAGDR